MVGRLQQRFGFQCLVVQVVGVRFLKGSVTCCVLFSIFFMICVMNLKILMKIVTDAQLKGVMNVLKTGQDQTFKYSQ